MLASNVSRPKPKHPKKLNCWALHWKVDTYLGFLKTSNQDFRVFRNRRRVTTSSTPKAEVDESNEFNQWKFKASTNGKSMENQWKSNESTISSSKSLCHDRISPSNPLNNLVKLDPNSSLSSSNGLSSSQDQEIPKKLLLHLTSQGVHGVWHQHVSIHYCTARFDRLEAMTFGRQE